MRIPKKVKIGVFNLDVKFVEMLDNGDTGGYVNMYTNILQIASKVKTDDDKKPVVVQQPVKEMEFLHELLHGIDFVYNAGNLSENTVNRLANGLYQVIIDNPDIFKK